MTRLRADLRRLALWCRRRGTTARHVRDLERQLTEARQNEAAERLDVARLCAQWAEVQPELAH